MSKCDFCAKEGKYYGMLQTYLVCEDHVKEGEKVESEYFEAMEEDAENGVCNE